LLLLDRTKIRLESRLRAYSAVVGAVSEASQKDNLEEQTANSALEALDAIHRALIEHQGPNTSDISARLQPALGSRDVKTVQTLLAIVSNWKLATLIAAFDASLGTLQSVTFTQETPAKLMELPDEASLIRKRHIEINRLTSIYHESSSALDRLRQLLGLEGNQSQLSDLVLHSCAPHIVALAIRHAHGPVFLKDDKERQREKEQSANFLRLLLRSLSTSSCLKILSASGHVGIQSRRNSPVFVRTAIERLYSAQLLRTDAVMALFSQVFGSEKEAGSDLMKKLAGIGQLLSTPPPNMSLDAFAAIIAPRLMDIVSVLPTNGLQEQQRSPSRVSTSTHKTAACFALARLHEVAPEALTRSANELLWKHLIPEQSERSQPVTDHVHAAVQLLYHLVEFSEPSTMFLSFLIGPVVVALFTLCSFLKDKTGKSIVEVNAKGKSAKSSLPSMAISLLKTWLRLADIEESNKLISPKSKVGLFATSGASVGSVQSGGDDQSHAYWSFKDDHIVFTWRNAQQATDLSTALSKLQMKDMHTLLTSHQDVDTSLPSFLSALDLSPSPQLLATLLKEASRKDVASQLLSDLLDCYTLSKQSAKTLSSSADNSADSIIYVQHILELINVFGSELISGQADKILSFINFALGTEAGAKEDGSKLSDDGTPFLQLNGHSNSPLAGLTSIGREAEEASTAPIQMDEEPDDELIETALNLLLSLLEGNPNISTKSHSLLKLISAKLEWHSSKSTSDEIRILAKEARLVLTARGLTTASSIDAIVSGTPLQRAFAKGNESYQEALRLLQDPILPVRAHGLIMLKELAACGSTNTSKARLMDPALTTAIVDIYIQAIQDDESFLYLNAVKGIAELANTGGKSMIKRLVGLYLGSSFSKEQVDMQLRMGEALLQVCQKLEEALSVYVDDIVHPLLTALRQSSRPTTLRSSYLSILGTCVEACSGAFTATSIGNALIDAMLDLLSVETSSLQSKQSQQDMQDPTNLDTKLPQLRRVAVLLLALFIRGSRHQLELSQEKRDDVSAQQEVGLTSLRMPNGSILQGENSDAQRNSVNQPLMFAEDKTERTKTILGYIAQYDNDSLVRHQSQQLLDELNLLNLSRIA
jgi:hypothetical protein